MNDPAYDFARMVGLELDHLRKNTRKTRIVRRRQLGAWIFRKVLARSFPECARAMGYASHGAVMECMKDSLHPDDVVKDADGFAFLTAWNDRTLRNGCRVFDDDEVDRVHSLVFGSKGVEL